MNEVIFKFLKRKYQEKKGQVDEITDEQLKQIVEKRQITQEQMTEIKSG